MASKTAFSDLTWSSWPVRRISDLRKVFTAHGVPVGRWVANETRPNVPAPTHRPHARSSTMLGFVSSSYSWSSESECANVRSLSSSRSTGLWGLVDGAGGGDGDRGGDGDDRA